MRTVRPSVDSLKVTLDFPLTTCPAPACPCTTTGDSTPSSDFTLDGEAASCFSFVCLISVQTGSTVRPSGWDVTGLKACEGESTVVDGGIGAMGRTRSAGARVELASAAERGEKAASNSASKADRERRAPVGLIAGGRG